MVENATVVNDPWLVMRTRFRQENTVEWFLNSKAVTTYLPRVSESRQWSDRKKRIVTPLFPGYIFLRPASRSFEALAYVPGSCGLVTFNHKPAQVPARILESVQLMEKSGLSLDVRADLIPGQKVQVCMGPLKGVCGELVKVKNGDRVVLNITVIGRSVSFEISAEELRLVG